MTKRDDNAIKICYPSKSIEWPDLELPPINLWSLPLYVEESPCKARCELDQSKVCMGCGRTLDEIKYWDILSEEDRLKIKQRLYEEGW